MHNLVTDLLISKANELSDIHFDLSFVLEFDCVTEHIQKDLLKPPLIEVDFRETTQLLMVEDNLEVLSP